jgi:toxin HigB-1
MHLEICNASRYGLYMILRFRHKGLERLFRAGDTSGVNAQHVRRLRQILLALNNATNPTGMNLPGLRLHQLKGERRGQWAVSVSGNWRVIFEFDGPYTTNIDLVDYH